LGGASNYSPYFQRFIMKFQIKTFAALSPQLLVSGFTVEHMSRAAIFKSMVYIAEQPI
jgi:hypothetical protein